MENALDTSPLVVRFSRIMRGANVRFIAQDSETLRPLLALSIYEAYLSERTASHNSVYDSIQPLNYLVTWAKRVGIDLDSIFLQGEMLTPRQVNAFWAWLRQRGKQRGEGALAADTMNRILDRASQAFRWFADQYTTFDGRASEREIHLKIYKDAIKERFAEKHVKVRKKKLADDLTEEEVTKIEQFLKPENRLEQFPKLSPAQALRDYLIWRLVIEFGFREGEVLALRLEDCPHRGQNHIKVVRVEERGADYIDPRGAYAPRPKTLSRELGFILANSPIPKRINDYTTKYRRRKVKKHGRELFQPVLDTPAFLILSHNRDSGNPLSIASLQDIAATIREGSGVDSFHWHMGRHAFFNRAYASIVDLKEKDGEMYKERLRDLVYWGGWESESSLQLYINRARRERAQTALCFYQEREVEWNALK